MEKITLTYPNFNFNYKFDSDFEKYHVIPSYLKKRIPRYSHLFIAKVKRLKYP